MLYLILFKLTMNSTSSVHLWHLSGCWEQWGHAVIRRDVTIINSLLEKVKQLDQSARLSPLCTMQASHLAAHAEHWPFYSSTCPCAQSAAPWAPVQHTLTHTHPDHQHPCHHHHSKPLTQHATNRSYCHRVKAKSGPYSSSHKWQLIPKSTSHRTQVTICSALTHCLTARDLGTKKNKTPLSWTCKSAPGLIFLLELRMFPHKHKSYLHRSLRVSSHHKLTTFR